MAGHAACPAHPDLACGVAWRNQLPWPDVTGGHSIPWCLWERCGGALWGTHLVPEPLGMASQGRPCVEGPLLGGWGVPSTCPCLPCQVPEAHSPLLCSLPPVVCSMPAPGVPSTWGLIAGLLSVVFAWRSRPRTDYC